MADNTEDRVIALERELAELKAAVKPVERHLTEREIAEWKDQWHQAAERRAANWWRPDPEQLRAMAAAVSPADCADLASHGTVQNRSVAGVSGTVSSVHPNAGLAGSHRGTGWREATPLRPPPGVAAADRLMDAQDARDRAELIMQEARRLAMQKVAELK
jgi:hypothetical protein